MKTLSRDEARRVYDRIGRLQDSQGFYEDPATDLVVRYGRFEQAQRVFELGCGTGQLAHRLLSTRLPRDASYEAIDISPTMVALAEARLAPFAPRARVRLCDGSPPVQEPAGHYDRFVSCYVLDLLAEEEIAAVLREAHRMLQPRGLLCLASLSTGSGPASRWVARVWSAVHRLSPSLVGGCRPLELGACLPDADWRVLHDERVAPFAVPSEVVIAERVGEGA
jgi:ubiquinone/menaquinone biosynthesis C-methylase UbiE